MKPETALALALALPLAAALATPLFARWPNLRETLTLAAGAVLLATVVSLVPHVLAGERPELELFEVLPGLVLGFRLEPLGMLFALVASGLWLVTSCYSIGYMRTHHEEHQTRYYACFAVAIFGALGVAFASNLFALFLFYELLTVSTYPLVAHQGTDSAMRGARVYVSLLLTTSIGMLLLAVIWTARLAGTLEFRPGGILAGRIEGPALLLLLALYAFGTGKAALMPFHRWLPSAMVAPTPVSALLHAVAVVKAGVFTVLKVVIYVFGPELLVSSGAGTWLGWVAAITIVWASLIAWSKDNLKARLAYSTVSQLSYIVLGAALANRYSLVGAGLHIAMHAFGKITLFFCAGAIYVTAHKTEIGEMRGIGRRMPLTTAAFLVGALSVIGLPPTGGAWSKWYLALGAADAGRLTWLAVLMVSSLMNVCYLLPIPIRGFFSAPDGGEEQGLREAPLFCLVPLCLTAAGSVALFFFADELYRLLLPLADGG